MATGVRPRLIDVRTRWGARAAALYTDAYAEQYRAHDETIRSGEAYGHFCAWLREVCNRFMRPIDVLDLGCGTGRYFQALPHVRRLVGIDVSQPMLERARHPVGEVSIPAECLTLVEGDFLKHEFPDGEFDLVYSIGVLAEHSPFDDTMASRVKRWLRPGGRFAFTTVHPMSFSVPRTVSRRIGERLLRIAPEGLRRRLRARLMSGGLYADEQRVEEVLAAVDLDVESIERFRSDVHLHVLAVARKRDHRIPNADRIPNLDRIPSPESQTPNPDRIPNPESQIPSPDRIPNPKSQTPNPDRIPNPESQIPTGIHLGIVYHMPFWRGADGTLREPEGSFARYVDSLAPYFDEISLCVPLLESPAGEGTPIRSTNVTVAPLPAFDGPLQFYRRLATVLPRLVRWARRIDVVHCRVPSPAAAFAFAIGRLLDRPAFILIVGDLRALLPTLPYRGIKRALWRWYTAFEERNIQWMADRALTFANGAALTAKHTRADRPVIETITTTIGERDIATREDTCLNRAVRLMSVSRIDPRKGLRVLPQAVRLLVDAGLDVTLDIVGPVVGSPGRDEQTAIVADAERFAVADRVRLVGIVPLDRLLPMYADYDLFVLPTLPGEGVPRVLLEAMSAGVPIVTTRVAGIPSLITHEANGLLVETAAAPNGPPYEYQALPEEIAGAVARIIRDADLRRALIANGYRTARTYTLETQAARIAAMVSSQLHVALRQPAAQPAG